MKLINGLSYKWKVNDIDESEVSKLSLDLNIYYSVASVLYNRGYKTKAKAQNFLFPFYDEERNHSKNLLNSEICIDRIIKAIKNNEKILICGDYDVDGITSTALLLYSLLECGANVNFFLPHRIKDGYGLSVKTIERAKRNNYTLLITVDNGTCAFDALKYARENNIDVIVTDHHQPKDYLPDAYCIVNPHQSSCSYPFKELAGVGVAFKVVQLLYEKLNKKLNDKIYELFLLGTIADVVPLVEENRYWIGYCLSKITNNRSDFMSLLRNNANLAEDKILTSTDIAFSIAPQLNALGRLDDPRDGVLFLISSSDEELKKIGSHIFQLNKKRKALESEIFTNLVADIEREGVSKIKEKGCIIKTNKNFPPGIVGLIAARLCQSYGVPALALHETEDGLLKGSARSIQECNIFNCISEIDPNLIVSFGGHSGAAGIAIKKENLNKFEEELSRIILEKCTKEDLEKKIFLDGILNIDEINSKLWKDLQLLEPFGAFNPVPTFYLKGVSFKDVTLLKDLHFKGNIYSDSGACPVIFFNKPEFYNMIKDNENKTFDMAVKITENNWNSRQKIELIGIDISINNK